MSIDRFLAALPDLVTGPWWVVWMIGAGLMLVLLWLLVGFVVMLLIAKEWFEDE